MMLFFDTIASWRGTLKDKFGVRFNPWPIFILGVVLLFMAYVFMPSIVALALSMALFIAPVWLPLLLVAGALGVWKIWRQGEFISSQKYILLELKPPRNVVKTPLAMEAFLSTLHVGPGESTWYVRWIKGAVRPWWSLELASFEGKVHFFIWTRTNFRRMIETQIYAQYPGAQVVEAPDYTRLISATPEEYSIWGCDFKHGSEAPLPIKTYVEYGLDKVQKEPEQVDPLANLIEFLGSAGKGEYIWLQMVFRQHKGERYGNKKNAKGKPYTWVDEAGELIQQIREATRMPYTDPATGKEVPGFPNPTKGQTEKIAAMERNIAKQGFDVGMRCVYLAKPDKFNLIVISQMNGLFNPFNSKGWNSIDASAWMRDFDDYPWELGADKLKDRYRRALVESYRRRQFFFEPFGWGIEPKDIMVMSTEELATVFHIPSRAVETPGLARIQSATSEAPANLPV